MRHRRNRQSYYSWVILKLSLYKSLLRRYGKPYTDAISVMQELVTSYNKETVHTPNHSYLVRSLHLTTSLPPPYYHRLWFHAQANDFVLYNSTYALASSPPPSNVPNFSAGNTDTFSSSNLYQSSSPSSSPPITPGAEEDEEAAGMEGWKTDRLTKPM